LKALSKIATEAALEQRRELDKVLARKQEQKKKEQEAQWELQR